MTDGTTGIQVAPITEDDMSRVHSILQRAADAIVGMSQLKADVDMLRGTVAGLQADVDRLRTQNANLDEALAHVRAERDEARTSLAAANDRLLIAEGRAVSLQDQVNDLGIANSGLTSRLAEAEQARDSAELHAMELEDELRGLKAKLDQVREGYEAIFGKAAAVPASASPPDHDPPAPPAALRPESLDQWEPGYVWDQSTGRYWREDVTPHSDGEALPVLR